ncbi:ATP-binding cassette domain-containing protein [candidate division KSB1 bacterium]|nr:ATP-binding cassette domain-containing protein [candidate division KSB1 bacterium]
MLTISNISKRYGDDLALDHFTLTIKPAQLTVLIGPSGCGKSTLLKLVMGLEEPDSGEIGWHKDIALLSSSLQQRRKIGYVIQEGGLFPHLTARKNVTLVADYLGWSSGKKRKRVEELAELVQLDFGLLQRYPLQLSGGQRQRISLMRALMLDPDILLLDEPLGALDPMVRADLQQDLKSIFQKLSKTVILVTHDMGEAIFFADRIVLMREGKIVQQGTAGEMIDRPVDPFVTRFIQAQQSPLHRLGEKR